MAKNRMAGEKLDEPTQESADAKEALSQSERRKRARERIGNDPERLAERLSGIDREKYDFDGYTDKQINMAMQGGTFGDEDYALLTGKEKDEKIKIPEVNIDPGSKKPVSPGIVVPDKPHVPFKPGYQGIGPGFGVGGQNINQNNDVTSNVTGDGNTVTNTQENSINGFAGAGAAARSKYLRDQYVANVSRFTGA